MPFTLSGRFEYRRNGKGHLDLGIRLQWLNCRPDVTGRPSSKSDTICPSCTAHSARNATRWLRIGARVRSDVVRYHKAVSAHFTGISRCCLLALQSRALPPHHDQFSAWFPGYSESEDKVNWSSQGLANGNKISLHPRCQVLVDLYNLSNV